MTTYEARITWPNGAGIWRWVPNEFRAYAWLEEMTKEGYVGETHKVAANSKQPRQPLQRPGREVTE